MSKPDESDSNRRRFLQAGVAAAIGGVCFSSATIKEALAKARQAGKPLFTAKNFNASLPQKHNNTLRRLMQEARQDIKAFIRQRFYLTKEQEKELDSLPEDLIGKIHSSIDEMLKEKAVVRVQIKGNEDRARQNNVSQQPKQQPPCQDGYRYSRHFTTVFNGAEYYPNASQVVCTAVYTKC
jgi:hypothetical protein